MEVQKSKYKKPRLTIFTPTYNRAYILDKLYLSLIRQTNKNFVWVVVDEGTDSTCQKIENWKNENSLFHIIYRKNKQGDPRGINRAMNMAIKESNTELFMKIDDDDYIDDDSVERIFKMVDSIKDRSSFAGVSGLRTYPNGKVIGHSWSH